MTLIVGNDEGNSLVGDQFGLPSNDTIRGLGGDDQLFGMLGDDSLEGGAGNDFLGGNAGNDTLDGGTENDTLSGQPGNDRLIGGAGDDLLYGGGDSDTLDGGTGTNQLQGDAGADVFAISIGGDNTLTDFSIFEGDRIDVSALGIMDFTSLLDMISATPTGTQLLFTGPGAITRVSFGTESELLSEAHFIFWSGPDELIVGGNATADSLFGGAGNDTMQGLGGNDTLDGGANDDILQGGAGDDSLIGGTGSDTLDGGAGSNQLVGGEGADVFVVNRGGTDTVTGFSAAEGDRIDLSGLGVSEFESVQSLLGNMTNGTLVFVGGNNSARMLLVDVLRNQLSAQQFVFDTSATTNDVLNGNALIRETMFGGFGNDTLEAAGGSDVLFGEGGNDVLRGSRETGAFTNNQQLFGGSGNDTLFGTQSGSLFGGSGDDVIILLDGTATAFGGTGADIFRLGETASAKSMTISDFRAFEGDRIDVSTLGFTDLAEVIANSSFDSATRVTTISRTIDGELVQFQVSNLNPTSFTNAQFIFAPNPNELIIGGDATADSLFGGAGNDTMQGLGGNDTLDGGANDEILQGGAGDDSLIGGTGSDTLDGGAGSNQLVGGEGADVFVVNRGGTDTVTGFSAAEGDRIDVSRLGISAFETVASLFVNVGNSSSIVLGGGTQMLLVDTLSSQLTAEQFLFNTVATDDTISGSADVVDVLFGGLGNDSLEAAGGRDLLYGEGGDDVLRGSRETGPARNNQILYGGSGNDTLFGAQSGQFYGGTGDDVITMLDGTGDAFGGAGADIFRLGGTANNTTLRIFDFSSSAGDRIDVSTLNLTSLEEVMAHSTHSTTTFVSTISRTFDGVVLQFQVTGILNPASFTAANFIFAPIPNRVIFGSDATADNLLGGAGNDTLVGRGGNDTMDGAAGDDSLDGGAGDDRLIGGAGDDWLRGGTGQDWLEGGTGDDRFYVDDAGDFVIEGADGGTADRVFASASYTLGSGVQVEYLSTNLASGTNQIDLTGNEFGQIITGNAGRSTLRGLGGDDVIYGLDGNDLLDGGSGSDTLYGGSGADTLMGGADADRMIGGLGNDSYIVDSVGDRVIETADAGWDTVIVSGLTSFTLLASQSIETVQVADIEDTSAMNLTGNDLSQTLSANNGANILRGLGGDDELVGLGGNDTLVGGAGNDVLDGGTGSDRLVGGLGNDTYIVDSRTDVISETAGQGTDTVLVIDGLSSFALSSWHEIESISAADQAGTAAMTLVGNSLSQAITGNAGANILRGLDGDDSLNGLGGNDQLFGGDGNDNLFGGDGSDRLTGGTGNDYMVAGAGADTLFGGAGADTFVFDSAIGGTEIDRIADFSAGEDVISLTSFIFSQIEIGLLAAEAFEVNESGVATNGATRIVYESDTGRLIYDMDGAGDTAGVHFATLNANLVGLSATDFLII